MNNDVKKTRRQNILEAFATMLEAGPGVRITTAALAREVGVSEAALYRHFPSKTKMFEGLIEFIEQALFERVNIITEDKNLGCIERCEKILHLLLVFSELNPGISRLLTGDALTGETERLHARIAQLFDRLETQLKQVLRQGELEENIQFSLSIAHTVACWLALVEGRIAKFVRTRFKEMPSQQWSNHWPSIKRGFICEKE